MSLFKKKPPEPTRPCAFCSGIPKLSKCGDQKEYFVYFCSMCYETPVRSYEARGSESAARKIWNQRTEEAEYTIRTYNRVMASQTKFTSSEATE
jgi:hypothetical protein